MLARVLVIDDSQVLVELTVSALRSAGYEAAGATDLASLDRQLSTGPFDLILVDVKMPEMFGDDVVEFLKSERGITSRLLLYSDIDEAELQRKVASSGADGAISKSTGIDGVLQAVATQLRARDAATDANQAGRKKRILIVDDSATTVMLLEAELRDKGFEVLTAENAEKATKIILKKQTRPDLVLLDVKMPNVNGEQFCRFIKSNNLFKGIKVLLCSAMEEKELQRICREAGADGYVAKNQVLAKVLSQQLAPE
ncbi:MAG TPA: response regulator [Myxococcaceae bacterium]|nr:response regulator [Myxococcaceae bacterium]